MTTNNALQEFLESSEKLKTLRQQSNELHRKIAEEASAKNATLIQKNSVNLVNEKDVFSNLSNLTKSFASLVVSTLQENNYIESPAALIDEELSRQYQVRDEAFMSAMRKRLDNDGVCILKNITRPNPFMQTSTPLILLSPEEFLAEKGKFLQTIEDNLEKNRKEREELQNAIDDELKKIKPPAVSPVRENIESTRIQNDKPDIDTAKHSRTWIQFLGELLSRYISSKLAQYLLGSTSLQEQIKRNTSAYVHTLSNQYANKKITSVDYQKKLAEVYQKELQTHETQSGYVSLQEQTQRVVMSLSLRYINKQIEFEEIQSQLNAQQAQCVLEYDRLFPEHCVTLNNLNFKDIQSHISDNATKVQAYFNEHHQDIYDIFKTTRYLSDLLKCYSALYKQNCNDPDTLSQLTQHMINLYPAIKHDVELIQNRGSIETNLLHSIARKMKEKSANSTTHEWLNVYNLYHEFTTINLEKDQGLGEQCMKKFYNNLEGLYWCLTAPSLVCAAPDLCNDILHYLETYYALPLKSIRGTPIARISDEDCIATIQFFNQKNIKTNTLPSGLRLLASPSWENYFLFEEELKKNYVYWKDPNTDAMIEQLMKICLGIEPKQQNTLDVTLAENVDIKSNHVVSVEQPIALAPEDSVEAEVPPNESTLMVNAPKSKRIGTNYPTLDVTYNDLPFAEKKWLSYKTTLHMAAELLRTPEDNASQMLDYAEQRDHAFFDHMAAIKQDYFQQFFPPKACMKKFKHQPIAEKITHASDDELPSMLTLFETRDALSAKIGVTKPDETIRPDLRTLLVKQWNKLRDQLYSHTKTLESAYESAYNEKNFDKNKSQNDWNQLKNTIEKHADLELRDSLIQLITHSSEKTLYRLLQRLCVLNYYQSAENNELNDSLNCIHRLYPNMLDALKATEDNIYQQLEHEDRLYEFVSNESFTPDGNISLQVLQMKLRRFLNVRSEYNFAVLYQHLSETPVISKHPDTKNLLDSLDILYPEVLAKYKDVQKNPITKIPSGRYADLLIQYNGIQSKSVVSLAIRSFLVESNWQNLNALQTAIAAHRNYILDKKLAKLMCALTEATMIKPDEISDALDGVSFTFLAQRYEAGRDSVAHLYSVHYTDLLLKHKNQLPNNDPISSAIQAFLTQPNWKNLIDLQKILASKEAVISHPNYFQNKQLARLMGESIKANEIELNKMVPKNDVDIRKNLQVVQRYINDKSESFEVALEKAQRHLEQDLERIIYAKETKKQYSDRMKKFIEVVTQAYNDKSKPLKVEFEKALNNLKGALEGIIHHEKQPTVTVKRLVSCLFRYTFALEGVNHPDYVNELTTHKCFKRAFRSLQLSIRSTDPSTPNKALKLCNDLLIELSRFKTTNPVGYDIAKTLVDLTAQELGIHRTDVIMEQNLNGPQRHQAKLC